MLLNAVTPARSKDAWMLRDDEERVLPIHPSFEAWVLLAMSGGYPLALFGEWDGDHLLPLSAWAEDEHVAFY